MIARLVATITMPSSTSPDNPVWFDSADTSWVFVDTLTLKDVSGSIDLGFTLANYTSDGPSHSSQSSAVSGAVSEWSSELSSIGAYFDVVYDGVDTDESQNPNDYVNIVMFSTLEDIGVGETLIKIGTADPNKGEVLDVDWSSPRLVDIPDIWAEGGCPHAKVSSVLSA